MEMNMVMLLAVIFVAIVVQFIVNACKGVVGERFCRAPVWSAVISVICCLFGGFDIFTACGFSLSAFFPPVGFYIGVVLTGLIASLGASTIYDIFTQLTDYRRKLAQPDKVDNADAV